MYTVHNRQYNTVISSSGFLSGVLWSGTFPTLVKYATDWEMDPRNWIDCRLQRFIMHTSIHLSAYFLVVMSAEKCFALHFPLQAKNLCSVNNAMKISVVNATIFSIYNTQWFFTLEKIYVKKINWFRCQIVNGPQFLKLHWRDVDAIIASYVPMVLMLSFNLAIIILLCINRGKDLGVGSTSKDMSKITKQVTAMLLSVTFVFIMLKCPVAIYMHTVGIHIRDDPITMSILTNFIYTNSSINTFLYMFCGSKYRERAFAIFKCLCVKNVEPSKQSSTTGPETEMQTISSASE